MNFNKIRNLFSFNIIAISGLITFVILAYFFSAIFIYFLKGYNINELGFPLVIIIFGVIILELFLSFIAVIILWVELVTKIKISYQKFLNYKFVFYLQIFGILFFLVPFVFIALVVIFGH